MLLFNDVENWNETLFDYFDCLREIRTHRRNLESAYNLIFAKNMALHRFEMSDRTVLFGRYKKLFSFVNHHNSNKGYPQYSTWHIETKFECICLFGAGI